MFPVPGLVPGSVPIRARARWQVDPVAGIQDAPNNTAPTRLRARVFRQAMQGTDAMRAEIRALQRRCAHLEGEARIGSADLRAEIARLQREFVSAGATRRRLSLRRSKPRGV